MYFGRIKSKIKVFIIAFLVILSIYQTANLWFENLSNYRFFYYLTNFSSFKSSRSPVDFNEKSVIINLGSNKFIQNFNNIYESSYKQVFDEVISLSIQKGKFSQDESFNIDLILNNKCVIYTFDYSTSGDEIATIFNTSKKNVSKIDNFNLVAIVPNLFKVDQVQVVFFDTNNLKQYEFVYNTSYGTRIYELINKFILDEDSYYISSFKSGFDFFDENQFILNWDTSYFKYANVYAENPVVLDGEVNPKILENYINLFFQNPSIKWHTLTEDTLTYSDESTVVKYYNNGVLEYSDYKSGSSQNGKGIFELYSIAVQFLNSDVNIKNEFYLKNYLLDQDKVTFYFDYKINDLPINLSESEKERLSMESIIEVVISQSKVSKYRRVIYDFYPLESFTYFSKSFLDAVDDIIYYEGYNENYSISNIEFAYNFQDLESNDYSLFAGWFIRIDDKIFFEN